MEGKYSNACNPGWHFDKILYDLFKKYVGLTPKVLCNIPKLNKFIAYRLQNPQMTLTACAHAVGYYDQAHLIKASHQLVHTSPKEYFKSNSHISNIFTKM